MIAVSSVPDSPILAFKFAVTQIFSSLAALVNAMICCPSEPVYDFAIPLTAL
jgi:hypothetical protein